MAQTDDTHIDEKVFSLSICRLCARQSDNMRDLYRSVHTGQHLLNMLQFCLQRPIAKGNGYPSGICVDCTGNLIATHQFHLLCNASEEHFRNMILLEKAHDIDYGTLQQLTNCNAKNEIKTEIEDDLICPENEDTVDTRDSNYDYMCNDDISETEKVNPRSTERRTLNKNFVKKFKSRDEINAAYYECYQCKETFTRIHSLRRHLTSHHPTDNKLFKCPDCKKQFSYMKSLYRHSQHKHKTKIYECERCPERCNSLKTLKKHCLKIHEEQLHKCDLCSWKFPLKVQLLLHMQKHDKAKRHICNICSEQFVTAMQLKGHIRDTHTSKFSLLLWQKFSSPTTLG